MKTFEITDHTADIGIIAYGTDLKEAFSHAAEGLFSLITNTEIIVEKSVRLVEVNSSDIEMLLATWLNELIFIFDTEHMIFSRFEVTDITDKRLIAKCYGEKIDLHRHELKRSVKAATYHKLQVVKENGYRAQVLFDV